MSTSTALEPSAPRSPMTVRQLPFDEIPRAAWQRLARLTPAATPFSSWTFHRAWWDAYEVTATQHYLVFSDEGREGAFDAGATSAEDLDDEGGIRAIVPLMRREGGAGTGPSPAAGTLFMAATYHADYATILGRPSDVHDVAVEVVAHLAALASSPVEVAGVPLVDLRRIRGTDPALGALRDAFVANAGSRGWRVRVELDDVCPVVRLAASWEEQLAGMSKKARHEVRRKLRRAERAGHVELRYLPLEGWAVEQVIALHQARWGADGLFGDSPSGQRSQRLLRRLAELEREAGEDAGFHLADVTIDGRVVYALAGFDDGTSCYFYNAGMDPGARHLSPGVVGTAAYIRDRLEAGRTRFDFLRGDEDYKYEWGAVDEPVYRLLVEPVDRGSGADGPGPRE